MAIDPSNVPVELRAAALVAAATIIAARNAADQESPDTHIPKSDSIAAECAETAKAILEAYLAPPRKP